MYAVVTPTGKKLIAISWVHTLIIGRKFWTALTLEFVQPLFMLRPVDNDIEAFYPSFVAFWP